MPDSYHISVEREIQFFFFLFSNIKTLKFCNLIFANFIVLIHLIEFQSSLYFSRRYSFEWELRIPSQAFTLLININIAHPE